MLPCNNITSRKQFIQCAVFSAENYLFFTHLSGCCFFFYQMDSVQVQVLSPLNSLLNLFQGPQRLIQKRNDKCLDYDRWSNKIDKIKDRDKLKAVSCPTLLN